MPEILSVSVFEDVISDSGETSGSVALPMETEAVPERPIIRSRSTSGSGWSCDAAPT